MSEEKHSLSFIIITGLSGAGKSQAIRSFEDLGYFCVDNLPPAMIPTFGQLCLKSEGKVNRVALVSDIRGGEFFHSLNDALKELEQMGITYQIVFLEATDEVLIRRFKETRRRHPLAEKGSIVDALKQERDILLPLRKIASQVIDTSGLTPQQLKETITEVYAQAGFDRSILITVISFGFKFGLPLDADLVFDLRFLPNPYYVEELRPLTGKETEVKDYVWRWVVSHQFYKHLLAFLDFLIPCYINEGKSQLVIGIGCTGGKHRSVVIADALTRKLKKDGYKAVAEHRDLGKNSEVSQ